MRKSLLASIIVFSLFFTSSVIAQTINEIQKLLAINGVEDDHFGYKVSISGDYTSNLQTVFGCDSIIETTVNVEDNSTELFTKVIIDEAASFNWLIGAQLGDYDNDGDQDILVTDSFEYIHIYKNELNSFSSEVSFPTIQASADLVKWFDYDNDSDLDVFIIGDDSPGIKLFRNNSGLYSEILIENLKAAQDGSFNAGDFNNDGYKDILITGNNSFDESNTSSNITQVIENNGASFSEIYKNMLPGTDWKGYVTWGDFDNDNYLDIVLSGYSYDDGGMVSKIYRNTGSSFLEIYPNSLAKAESSRIACADYNNDGLLDILWFGAEWEYGGESFTKLYQNTGSGFTEIVGANISGVPFSTAWGDYDNDGDLDLVLSGDKIFRNNGDDTFTQVYYDALQENYGRSCWGDYDNDGDLDIISVYGDLMIYVNNTDIKNNLALAPQNTNSNILGKDATLKWDKTTDTETPQNGLSYNIEVYTISKSKAQTLYTKIEQIRYNETGYTLNNLPPGQYSWKVQAFDTGLKGGEFSDEQTFTIGGITGNTYYKELSICAGEIYSFGSQELSNTGEYTETFTASDDSDSTVVLTLIVNPVYDLSETVVVNHGDNYTFPDGTTQNNITSQVIYTSNLNSTLGCDSIIETTVSINETGECHFSESFTICSESDYTFPDGTTQENITSQVVHESIILSALACDTIIETTLNVNPISTTYLTDTICHGESIQIGYAICSGTGMYGVTLTNQYGCDSTVYLDLTVLKPDVDLGRNRTIDSNDTIILDAGVGFESYNWSTQETSQTIIIDGSFGEGSHTIKVIVTDENSCTGNDSTSITISNVTDISFADEFGEINIYPNPTTGKINIDLAEINESIEISIFDITGKLLIKNEIKANESSFETEIPGEKGIYFIRLKSELRSSTFKIIKN